jgi:general secretion pathway protein G
MGPVVLFRYHQPPEKNLPSPDRGVTRNSFSRRISNCIPWRTIAFTLVEIMIVVAIIGTLAGLAIPSMGRVLTRVQIMKAINDIRTIQTDIEMFEMAEGRIPTSLDEIGRDQLLDPWQRPYVYLSFAAAGPSWKGKARKDHSLVPLNSTYDLYSLGKDGKSVGPLTAKASDDDVVRAHDGGFIGLGSDF